MLQARRSFMNTDIAAQRIGAGAAAGLVGTALIQGLMGASQKWAPQSLPPIKQDPGEFMVEKVEAQLPDKLHEKIPERLEKPQLKCSHLAMVRPSALCTPHPVRRPRAYYWKAAPWVWPPGLWAISAGCRQAA